MDHLKSLLNYFFFSLFLFLFCLSSVSVVSLLFSPFSHVLYVLFSPFSIPQWLCLRVIQLCVCVCVCVCVSVCVCEFHSVLSPHCLVQRVRRERKKERQKEREKEKKKNTS